MRPFTDFSSFKTIRLTGSFTTLIYTKSACAVYNGTATVIGLHMTTLLSLKLLLAV